MSPAEPHLFDPAPETLAAVGASLAAAGYTAEGLADALGRRPVATATRANVYRHRLAKAGELGTLIRLFRLGDPVALADAELALGPAAVAALTDAHILVTHAAEVEATLQLTPFRGLLFLHDRDEPGEPPTWHVMGIGPGTEGLASLTVGTPVRTALDVGTGCGVHALLAASRAGRVVATDVNERALRLTRINAALNGIDNVETRLGSLFEPVGGERFDLVVSNPPFVVSPASEIMFRDAGLERDELSRRVLAGLPHVMESGGHASMLGSWIVDEGAEWSEAPRQWLRGSACDALLFHFTTDEPLTYAAKYTRDLDRWLAYYDRLGVRGIATGAVVLRRPGSERFRALQSTGAPRGDGGAHVLRMLDAQERPLPDDDELRGVRFHLVVPHRLDQVAHFRESAYAVGATMLSLPDGAGVNALVETDAVHVLPRLDGRTPLGAVLERAARETGLERWRLEAAAVASVRRLYALGFVERLGATSPRTSRVARPSRRRHPA